jgi:CheY-like chemotaxis protein
VAKKILVVDDEDSLRKSIAIMLRLRGGYEVVEASDGLMGVDVATAEKPDLIISDVYMDNMNGFMMVDEIQSQPGTAKIPVIMMTSVEIWRSGGIPGQRVHAAAIAGGGAEDTGGIGTLRMICDC